MILPRFGDSIPPFLVLLPGAVSMSLAKVMGSYVAGRGRPGVMAMGTIGVLIINVALNILLIPKLGIVGASLASLVSYTLQAGLYVYLASRLSGQPWRSLFVPGRDELRILFGTGTRLLSRVLKMAGLARFR
jgi:O-antigen/teichoic acid export membrane protein